MVAPHLAVSPPATFAGLARERQRRDSQRRAPRRRIGRASSVPPSLCGRTRRPGLRSFAQLLGDAAPSSNSFPRDRDARASRARLRRRHAKRSSRTPCDGHAARHGTTPPARSTRSAARAANPGPRDATRSAASYAWPARWRSGSRRRRRRTVRRRACRIARVQRTRHPLVIRGIGVHGREARDRRLEESPRPLELAHARVGGEKETYGA